MDRRRGYDEERRKTDKRRDERDPRNDDRRYNDSDRRRGRRESDYDDKSARRSTRRSQDDNYADDERRGRSRRDYADDYHSQRGYRNRDDRDYRDRESDRKSIRRDDSRREGRKRPGSRSPSPSNDPKQPKMTKEVNLAQKEASIEERMKMLIGGGSDSINAANNGANNGANNALRSNVVETQKPSSLLKTAIHPSLMLDPITKSLEMKRADTNVLLPKANFATIKANVRGAQQSRQLKLGAVKFETFKNPYYDRGIGLPNPQKLMHKPKRLRFAPQGKFIAAAEKMRVEEKRRLLEKKIAETTERAGLGLELDVTESLTKLEPLPDAEWWDCQFLPLGSYEQLPDLLDDKESTMKMDDDNANDHNISNTDNNSKADPSSVISYELVTHLIHHPIPLDAPADAAAAAAGTRQLMLTEKERKRLRRQRRMEALKDKQERIRIGLLPPEEAKVKLSNIMRVLGDQAVQDPSRVESMVREQVAARKEKHERENEQRKLSAQEVREKKIKKLQEDTSIYTNVAVFKVKDLTHPKFQFKVDMNAKQSYLTGCALVHRKKSIVVVEGGPKGIKRYKNLMLNRIKWNEESQILERSHTDEASSSAAPSATASTNECTLVWEGVTKNPAFKEFTFKQCEMEVDAKLFLQEHDVEFYWKYIQ